MRKRKFSISLLLGIFLATAGCSESNKTHQGVFLPSGIKSSQLNLGADTAEIRLEYLGGEIHQITGAVARDNFGNFSITQNNAPQPFKVDCVRNASDKTWVCIKNWGDFPFVDPGPLMFN